MNNDFFTPDEIDEILFEECCNTDFNAALSFFMRVINPICIRVTRDRTRIEVVNTKLYFNQQGEIKRVSGNELYERLSVHFTLGNPNQAA